ncbi:uncharacterized protein LOC135201791 [Macrobrachium nipponense]|uniref:uncharacterized protein LOC135201791 n=1 Tax=Macrobrachium nipponense TaxID=159736 RepID=UPI0030C81762
MKVLICVLALFATAASRSAYRFSDGYLDILGGEPSQTFDCAGRAYGYYADVANACQVFHICLPIPNEVGDVVDMAQFSFFCGNQTVFSQESLTCAHPQEAFPCEESETLYDLSNADFGKIPEGNANVDLGRSLDAETANADVGGAVEVEVEVEAAVADDAVAVDYE